MSNRLPSALIKKLNQEYGFEESSFFKVHEDGEQVTSVRLNPYKLSAAFKGAEKIPWSKYGRYLKERPSFIADPLFHAGCYYVQEASSMFLEHILRETVNLEEDIRILDLCAAPGGKSTLISSLISDNSLLVSNEIIKTRVPALSDNLTKWGRLNTVVTNNDPKDYQRLSGYFDVMVVDAPCSGSGMWRKDPNTLNEWSESNVIMCSERQQRILADSFAALREGGILIYSTCSYSKEENEEICDWLKDTFELSSIQINISAEYGIVETESAKHHCFGYRFYPNKVKGEGFFVACFRKDGEESQVSFPRIKPEKPNYKELEIVKRWLTDSDDLAIFPAKDGYAVMNTSHLKDITLLQSKLYIKKSGIIAGKVMGKDLVPDHELALSLAVSGEVQRIELTYQQAISYLRRDDLKIDEGATGWSLICYEGFGLGWAKILPNRLNNYYPKELRILKDI